MVYLVKRLTYFPLSYSRVIAMFIQRQTAERLREVAYQDDTLTVEVGINPNGEGIQTDNRRNYSNCIKMTANSANAHFIQFVTRQVPDLYLYETSQKKTVVWDEVFTDSHYMIDFNHRWKVDVTEDAKSCFYEDEGINQRGNNFLSIYDYPGGNFRRKSYILYFCDVK